MYLIRQFSEAKESFSKKYNDYISFQVLSKHGKEVFSRQFLLGKDANTCDIGIWHDDIEIFLLR